MLNLAFKDPPDQAVWNALTAAGFGSSVTLSKGSNDGPAPPSVLPATLLHRLRPSRNMPPPPPPPMPHRRLPPPSTIPPLMPIVSDIPATAEYYATEHTFIGDDTKSDIRKYGTKTRNVGIIDLTSEDEETTVTNFEKSVSQSILAFAPNADQFGWSAAPIVPQAAVVQAGSPGMVGHYPQQIQSNYALPEYPQSVPMGYRNPYHAARNDTFSTTAPTRGPILPRDTGSGRFISTAGNSPVSNQTTYPPPSTQVSACGIYPEQIHQGRSRPAMARGTSRGRGRPCHNLPRAPHLTQRDALFERHNSAAGRAGNPAMSRRNPVQTRGHPIPNVVNAGINAGRTRDRVHNSEGKQCPYCLTLLQNDNGLRIHMRHCLRRPWQ